MRFLYIGIFGPFIRIFIWEGASAGLSFTGNVAWKTMFWSTFTETKTVHASASVSGWSCNSWLITTGVLWKPFYHSLFASCEQGCWAGWGEHPARKKRRRRTRRRTKSQRTPVPPRSQRVTRRAKRRTSRRPQRSPQPLPPRPHRQPQHVRAAENFATDLAEQLWLMSVVDLVSVCCSDPDWASHWTLHRLSLSWRWWVTHGRPYSYSHIYNQGVALAWWVKQLAWLPRGQCMESRLQLSRCKSVIGQDIEP